MTTIYEQKMMVVGKESKALECRDACGRFLPYQIAASKPVRSQRKQVFEQAPKTSLSSRGLTLYQAPNSSLL